LDEFLTRRPIRQPWRQHDLQLAFPAQRAKVPRDLGSPVLYTAIRDALLSKVGVGKGWSEDEEPQKTERNHDQPDDAFAVRDHGAFLPVLLAA
jgi:hypothetical protein